MKKFIIVTIILVLCFAVAECGKETNVETQSATETATEPVTEIPGAKEFPEMSWPTFGIATKVPTPDWSNHGEILTDSEMLFWCQLGNSTVEKFNDYVKACQDKGYTENYYSTPGYFYYGEDSEGRAVQLTYDQYDHYIAIQVTGDAAGWTKWWVK